MQIMKKSRVFLLAAVLILQLIMLPLAEASRAAASEVSDHLVFMQKDKELTGKDKNDPLSLKLGGQETVTLKRSKNEADLEVKVSLPDLVDLDKTATDKANKELKVNKAEEAVTEVAASEKEGRHLLLHFAKGQSELKFTLTGKEVGSGQLIATYQEDGKEYSSYPLVIKVENEETKASSALSSSVSSSSEQQPSSQSSQTAASSQPAKESSVSTASQNSGEEFSSSKGEGPEKAMTRENSSRTANATVPEKAVSPSTNEMIANLSQAKSAFNSINTRLFTSNLLASTTVTTKANADLAIASDDSPNMVWAGDTALFTINFKVSGSRYDEADRWPATLSFSLKNNANNHLKLKTDVLPEVAGVKPTITDGKIVYTFQKSNLKAGQSYIFKLAVNTDNGYINQATPVELAGSFKDNTGYEVKASSYTQIAANTSASISTTFLGAKNSSPNTAPGRRDTLAWRISLSIPSKSGLNFLDPSQKLQISYQLQDGTYDGITDPDGNLIYLGTSDKTISWEIPTPSIEEQAASLAKGQPLVTKSFIVYTKPSKFRWDANELITNTATLTAKNLQNDVVRVSSTATGQIGQTITGNVNSNGDVLYPNFYGPKDGEGNMGLNALTTVYDTAKLLYASQYFTGTDGISTTEQYNSRGNLVRRNISSGTFNGSIINGLLNTGLQKSVVHYDIDSHVIIKSLEFSTPWLQLYVSQGSTSYPSGTAPGTMATLYLRNIETGSLRTVTKYVTQNGQLPLSYFGVNENERLVAADFSIQYEDANKMIDARTAGAVFMRGGVEEGYVGKATVTTQAYIVAKDGTKYVHYSTTNQKTANGEFSPIGPRSIQVIEKSSSIPIGRTDVSFTQHALDGETVIQKNSSNRVVADFYNVTNSPIATKSPTVLSVLLPKGVTVDSANSDIKMYLVNDRTGQETLLAQGLAGNWAGTFTYKRTLKNKDSVDTGQQYVKFVMGEAQGNLLPGYHLRGEFNVNIGDVASPVTLQAFGASYSGQMYAPTGYNLITDKNSNDVSDGQAYREVSDLFGDGSLKVAVASKQSYSLSSYDNLKTEKEVKGDLDSSYSSLAHVSLGGQISYRLKFSNTDGQAISKLTLLDVLPSVGDLGITDNVDRESKFTSVLTGPISLTNSNLEIKYSTASKPSRQLLNNSVTNWPAGAQKLQDPAGAETPTWLTASQVTDWSKIRSFTISLKSGQLIKAGQITTIEFTMQAPKRTDLTASQLQTLLNPNTDEKTRAAWNSFALTTNNLLPVEPARVGVVLQDASATIIKKDAVSGQTLSGVEFKLADSEANAKAGRFLRQVDGKVVTPSDSNYSSGQDYVLKSDANGQLLFTGLKNGQSYYAVETAALDGYQLDSTPHAVKASYQTGQAAITVYNQKQLILPKTGSSWMALFLIVGISGILAGFYFSRKKKEQD